MSNDISRLLFAAAFAADRHRDQRCKNADASPYVNHPLAVAAVLANDGGISDLELLVAALLHDTVEDTATSLDEITQLFGNAVSGLVKEVTDDKSLPRERRKQLQIENAAHKSDLAKQLKIADKICNVRDIDSTSPADWDANRKAQYLDWAVAVIDGCRDVNHTLDQLFDQAIAQARDRLKE